MASFLTVEWTISQSAHPAPVGDTHACQALSGMGKFRVGMARHVGFEHLYLGTQAMKRPHSDARYYNCTDTSCTGTMIQCGQELHGKKQAVYECTECKRKARESMLLMAYNEVKWRD
jgi:hypothetical protein